MKRFEYNLYHLKDKDNVLDNLDELGADGWELICIDTEIAYFKREVDMPILDESEIKVNFDE